MAPIPRCYNHPGTVATATCADCGAGICAACTRTLRGQPFCLADYAIMRREPPDAHLRVEVPPYQPPQYRYQLPLLEAESAVVNVPQPSGSLFGSGLVSASPPLRVQPSPPTDAITKWAWVGLVCGLIAIGGVAAVVVLASVFSYLPDWLFVGTEYSVPVLLAVGLLLSIIAWCLNQRSNRPNVVEPVASFGMVLNGSMLFLVGGLIYALKKLGLSILYD